jgi:hypothetical protein
MARFKGTFEGRTTGLSWGGAAIIVVVFGVLALASAHAHEKQLGRQVSQTLDIIDICVISVAGLVVLAVVAGLVFWLRRNVFTPKPASQLSASKEVAVAGQERMTNWGLPTGFYGGQPHRAVNPASGTEKRVIEAPPQVVVHHHHGNEIHVHGDDGAEVIRSSMNGSDIYGD